MTYRIDWTAAVATAEITATPVKVSRTRNYGATTYSFWELALEINGQAIDAEAFRTNFKTRKAAVEGAFEWVSEVREMLSTTEFYFESQDYPELDYVKAVLS